jgi:acyl-CoA synthetase (AMP-forming)/AMP-acid ligase II
MWRSGYPDVRVGGTTFPEMVQRQVERTPDHLALMDGPSGLSVTYAEFGRRVERISAWLAHRGIGPGHTVAIWAPNSPPWAACALAAMRIGAAVTAINPASTAEEASRQLTDADVALVVAIGPLVPLARQMGIRDVIAIGGSDGATDLRDVLASEHPTPAAATDPDAVALLPYSSGTAGLPKGVMLTHSNLVTAVRQVGAVAGFTERDTVLALAPFFHVLGAVVTLAVPLAVGATTVTVPRFEPAAVLDIVDRHRITATAVPPPVAGFLAHRDTDHALSTLELLAVGGAPLSGAVHEALAARLPGCVVAQGWGMTETTGSVCVPDRRNPGPPGTVGRLLPNTELKVVGTDTGDEVGPGAAGELWVRGPQLMAGYLNQPVATAEIIDTDGWLHTGDLGHIDSDGNVVVLDRLKELIKVDGYQVAPAELEALLLSYPPITDAAVTGRADDRHGEVPVAYVVAAEDLDPEKVQAWVTERVAPHKRIAAVTIVDHLPRTPSGKLLRRVLRGR